jgi:hypothetical protein
MEYTLTIDKEFQSYGPPLTPEELNLLDASINADGCKEAIEVWANHNETIIDGHNRFRICKSCKLDYKTRALKFETRGEVINYIINKALGRRNLTDLQKSNLRGGRYINENKGPGAPEGNNNRNQCAQNAHIDSNAPTTAEKLGDEYGVDPATIRRDADFAAGLAKIKDACGDEIRNDILSKKIKVSKQVVSSIGKNKGATSEQIQDLIKNAQKPKERKANGRKTTKKTFNELIKEGTIPKPKQTNSISQKTIAVSKAIECGIKPAECFGQYGLSIGVHKRSKIVVASKNQSLIDAMDSELLSPNAASCAVNFSQKEIDLILEKAESEKAAKNHKPLSVAGRSKQELLRELLERTYADWAGASNNRPITNSCIPSNAEKLADLELLCKNVRRYVNEYLKKIEEEIANVRQG